jgi:hypothetical protein
MRNSHGFCAFNPAGRSITLIRIYFPFSRPTVASSHSALETPCGAWFTDSIWPGAGAGTWLRPLTHDDLSLSLLILNDAFPCLPRHARVTKHSVSVPTRLVQCDAARCNS